ncbi:MAG: DNA polymerase III subunit alpha [Clostridiaceae bacterium]|nr:DNA polymerase III subunit alpha [Clostridiaceae bacterium]
MTDFVHLHLHTEYSLLDGACRIADMMEYAKSLGQKSVAITDHGVMYGVVAFYNAAKKAGLHPVIGCEVYLAPGSRFDRDRETGNPMHLVLLAETQEGYQNLMALVSAGFVEGFYSKPRIDLDILRTHTKGLIACSACLSGPLSRAILQNDNDRARKMAVTMNEIFGQDNFFIELQDHRLRMEPEVNRVLREIAHELGIPMVVTNDVHYMRREDSYTQDVLMCVQTNKTVDEPDRMKFETDEFYLKSGDEMAALFPGDADAIANTVRIAERCRVEFEFDQYHLPVFPLPDNADPAEYLRERAYEGLRERYGDRAESLKERCDYELGVINKMGFAVYFLIVADFIAHARAEHIPVGEGRGSSANSIVSYSLHITNVDPMRFDLFFDRFLNPERVSMPDIDMDYCYIRRQEMIDYAIQKYGADHVAQIVTFGTMAARAAVRDVGRALGVSYADTDAIAKLVPNELHITLKNALNVNPQLRERYESDPTTKRVLDTAMALEGMPRHASTHAAGVVITDRPVSEYVPLARNDEAIVTQFDMNTVADMGLLKMDFLGLRNVTVIDEAQALVRRRIPDFDIKKVPDDDPATYDYLATGKTSGIFQIESAGMTNVVVGLKPRSIDEITAVIALYRPGPMDSIPRYIECKFDPSKITYKTPLLEDILKETNGCIVYQEQVMAICRKLAGYSLGRADIVRRAMSKKKLSVLEQERHNFIYGNPELGIDGALARGVPEDAAVSIFDEMQEFAKYAFPKGHAVSYAFISFQTAYLKCHYPREYMAALLTSVLDFTPKVSEYIAECHAMGIAVLPPDVNESDDGFTVAGENIRFGLGAIKNVGHAFVRGLIRERTDNGPFKTFKSFCDRMVTNDLNRRALDSLIRAGAFTGFGLTRATLLSSYDRVLDAAAADAKYRLSGQLSMFEMASALPPDEREADMQLLPELDRTELLHMEKEAAGLYLSGHPMEVYETTLAKMRLPRLASVIEGFRENIEDFRDGEYVTIAGLIAQIRVKATKNASMMAYVTIEDTSASIETLLFNRTLQASGGLLREGVAVRVRGRLSGREEEDPKLVVDEIAPLVILDDPAQIPPPEETLQAPPVALDPENPKKLYIRFNDENCARFEQVMATLRVFHGTLPVSLYDTGTKEYTDAGKPQYFMASPILYKALRGLVGDENVVVK